MPHIAASMARFRSAVSLRVDAASGFVSGAGAASASASIIASLATYQQGFAILGRPKGCLNRGKPAESLAFPGRRLRADAKRPDPWRSPPKMGGGRLLRFETS